MQRDRRAHLGPHLVVEQEPWLQRKVEMFSGQGGRRTGTQSGPEVKAGVCSDGGQVHRIQGLAGRPGHQQQGFDNRKPLALRTEWF